MYYGNRMRVLVIAILGGMSLQLQAQEKGLELNECLTLSTFAERQDCLNGHIELKRLENELSNLTGGTNQNQTEEDYPLPVGYYSGPKIGKYAEMKYSGGKIIARQGDTLAGGWKVIALTRTSVHLVRNGKDLHLGYSDGADQPDVFPAGAPGIIPMPASLPPPPARPY